MRNQKSITEKELNQKLIEHYRSFNQERFWLDAYGESSGTCVICCHVYDSSVTFEECKSIARYVKKCIPYELFSYIYVGPFHFKPNEL